MTNEGKRSLLAHQDDFDFWKSLAEKDPASFEAQRERFFNEFIASQPEEMQSSLHRVQWRVDQSRRLARNPIDAMNRVSKLMWDELVRLNHHQKRLVSVMSGEEAEAPEMKKAAIVAFPDRNE